MNNRIVTIPSTQIAAGTRRALLACGLWMRAAFIGASATVIGVIQLFEGEWSALSALLTAAAGVALMLLSYRRAWAALNNADKATSAPVAIPAAAHR